MISQQVFNYEFFVKKIRQIDWYTWLDKKLLSNIFLQVCELDIIFNFEKAYFMLDELTLGGEIQETSKKNVLKAIAAQDLLQEEETPQGFFEDAGLG